jgi:hypothetical protein
MTAEELLRKSFVYLEVNGDFSQATLSMRDGSWLRFCHRVDERWVKSESPGMVGSDVALAGQVLVLISFFRLNTKHLDVLFTDGTRWEAGLGEVRAGS